MEINEKLAHLTPEQLDDLINRYHGKEKLAALINEFGIDAKPSNLVFLLPPVLHEDLFCPYCKDTNLVSKTASRAAYSYRSNTPSCPKCKHQNSERCWCGNCQEKGDYARREAEQRKRYIIEAEYTRESEIPSLDKITLKDSVFILSLVRHSLTEDLRYVEPFNKDVIALAPLHAFQNEIVMHLYKKGFITISPESHVDAFIFDQAETYIDAYYPAKVLWAFLPGLDVENKRDYLKELETIANWDVSFESWRSEIPKLWNQIAKYECLEFFIYLLADRGYRLDKIGEKTHTTFENLLEDFSVSRINYLSWIAVKDTTDYIVRKKISKGHGKNIFIGAIQRKADKAKAEGWEVRHFRRNSNCPQTAVSSTFFDHFLGLGDRVFETVPPKIDGT